MPGLTSSLFPAVHLSDTDVVYLRMVWPTIQNVSHNPVLAWLPPRPPCACQPPLLHFVAHTMPKAAHSPPFPSCCAACTTQNLFNRYNPDWSAMYEEGKWLCTPCMPGTAGIMHATIC